MDVERDGKKVAALGAGDFFGELALISKIPRTATVTTTSPIRALVVVDRDFRRLLKDDVTVAVKVLGTLAERMPRPTRTEREGLAERCSSPWRAGGCDARTQGARVLDKYVGDRGRRSAASSVIPAAQSLFARPSYLVHRSCERRSCRSSGPGLSNWSSNSA